MRLEPIERPRNPLLRLGYWYARRKLGKVPSVLKVVYARAPRLLRQGLALQGYLEKGTSLAPELRLLLQAAVAEANGCGFCLDLARAQAVEEHLGLDKFEALPGYETHPLFDEAERAALAYVAESSRAGRVSDATFERLRKSFDERQIVEITVVGAIESYYNRIAIPLGLESDGFCALARQRAG